MSALFPAYGKYLLGIAVLCLLASAIELRVPLKAHGDRVVARYPVSAMLLSGVMLIFAALFAFAVASLDRDSALARLGIWSLVGAPIVAVAFEIIGKRVRVADDVLSRSYFGMFSFERRRRDVASVGYDSRWKAFRIRFVDGSVLRMPAAMRGSAQVAEQLSIDKA